MDQHPPNLFIRGWASAAQGPLPRPVTFHRYLSSALPQHAGFIQGQGGLLRRGCFLSSHVYYTQMEALQALALPHPPTHVITFSLPPATPLAGPAWVEPLAPARVPVQPGIHRFGDGLEYVLLKDYPLGEDDYTIAALT